MNNFGVIEIASAKTTNAPGWAYVPDRQPHHHHLSAAPATTSNRKRARAAASGAGVQLSLADANARQEAKARREIEILDRDNARDVQIAIPAKALRTGGAGGKKYTPNVRRILQSQKTFANHLDDYIALLAQQAESNTPTTNTAINATSNNNNRGGTPATSTSTRSRQVSAPAPRRPSARTQPEPPPSADVEMVDIQQPSESQSQTQSQVPQPRKSTILTPYPQPPPHPEDTNPLLTSRLPPIPTDDELRALLSAPPLSYLEARGTWGGGNEEQQRQQQQPRYPTRVFCAVCGYWGRVRCMKCGTRVCALECLETHQEECITRYGL
ncbi:hypothetical protein GGR55DRAFT_624429 [Xylaria sp. FL0064]|nr:hypothetical protein GGR55DRAFT_624429 [Xylaria sp. FL0064]